ncbi:MAG TPA: trehalose-phosphatase [Vitreimonas sp.]|nr:trehalose-phosphatase [Vitreimonas sp.]
MTDSQLSACALAPPLPLNLAQTALFLDLDGTLLDLAPTPDEVNADAALHALLRELQARTDGATAVLTGRSLQDADRLLQRSIVCVGALHGRQCRTGASLLPQPQPSEAWRTAKETVAQLVRRGALEADMEDKGDAIALHYRAQPERGALIARAIEEIADTYGLRALHGKMVSELMPVGATKGVALSTFMQAPPFAGRTPVAVGDDITDEDAFVAANALSGASVLVGERSNTNARFSLRDVAAVRAWLAAAL